MFSLARFFVGAASALLLVTGSPGRAEVTRSTDRTPVVSLAVRPHQIEAGVWDVGLLVRGTDGGLRLVFRALDRADGLPTAADRVAEVPADLEPTAIAWSPVEPSIWVAIAWDAPKAQEVMIEADHGIGFSPTSPGLLTGQEPWGRVPNQFVVEPDGGGVTSLALARPDGNVLLAHPDGSTSEVTVSGAPVIDVGPVPQLGHYSLLTLDGQHLDLVPLGDPPGESMRLADLPRPLADIATPLPALGQPPLVAPAAVPFVVCDGSAELAVLEIPPRPGPAAGVVTRLSQRIVTPLGQSVLAPLGDGLFLRAVDGSAVLHDPEFTLESGLSGELWTVVGAALDVDPSVISRSNRERLLIARVEVAGAGAEDIDPETLLLTDGRRRVAPLRGHLPRLEDADGDGNPELAATFDLRDVQSLLRPRLKSGAALVQALWRYSDGERGSALAEVLVQD